MSDNVSAPTNPNPAPFPQGQPQYPPAYPYPYPYPQPQPKPPMDPAKKKKLIIGLSVGIGALVLGIVAAIVLPIILRVDYSAAYQQAKDLKPKISDIYNDYSCERIVDYLDDDYISTRSYNEYIEECRGLYDGVSEQIAQLGGTPGVMRDNNINEQFSAFQTAYDATIPDMDKLNIALPIYSAWHEYTEKKGDLGFWSSTSDNEVIAAAAPLTNSDNETLKTYGDTWLEKTLATLHAYKNWDNASYGSSNRSSLRSTYEDLKTDRDNWITANKPNIAELYSLTFNDPNRLNTEFNKLYELIRKAYEQNYNEESGDCIEFLGEVECA